MIVKRYLLSNLWHTFTPIFTTLFVITSVVLLVRIAKLTSYFQLNISEMFQLYTYNLPTIIFFVLPLSIFAALASNFAKLAGQNELVVINSLCIKPTKLLRTFFLITLISSIISLIMSIGFIEKTNYYYKQFKTMKKTQAKFNIKASQYGQRFGDWLIYIESKDKHNYHNLKLFKTDPKSDNLIIAKNADIKVEGGSTHMVLQEGRSFLISKKELNQIDFNSMIMRDRIYSKPFGTYKDYWSDVLQDKKKAQKLTQYILISLFPLISIFFILSIGYYNPRYESNKSGSKTIALIVIFYVLIFNASKMYPIHSILFISIGWFLLGYIHYRYRVKNIY
jgi:lipopolysaccharide export system permease protein